MFASDSLGRPVILKKARQITSTPQMFRRAYLLRFVPSVFLDLLIGLELSPVQDMLDDGRLLDYSNVKWHRRKE